MDKDGSIYGGNVKMTKEKAEILLEYDFETDKTKIKSTINVDAVLLMDMTHDAQELADEKFNRWWKSLKGVQREDAIKRIIKKHKTKKRGNKSG